MEEQQMVCVTQVDTLAKHVPAADLASFVTVLDRIHGDGVTPEGARQLMPRQEHRKNLRLVQSPSGKVYGERSHPGGDRTDYFFPYQSTRRIAGYFTPSEAHGEYERSLTWLPLVTLPHPVIGGIEVTDV